MVLLIHCHKVHFEAVRSDISQVWSSDEFPHGSDRLIYVCRKKSCCSLCFVDSSFKSISSSKIYLLKLQIKNRWYLFFFFQSKRPYLPIIYSINRLFTLQKISIHFFFYHSFILKPYSIQ